MKLTISEEIRQAVEQSQMPIEVHDEQTNDVFYLLSPEQYRKVKTMLELVEIDPSFYEFTEIEMFGRNDQ